MSRSPRRSIRRSIRRSFVPLVALGAGLLLASCGKSLGARVGEAMDGCIELRNPAFTSGNGVTALETPFPDSLVAAVTKIAYQRAFTSYAQIADAARDQVTLVCALELASYLRHGDVAVMLWRYTRHPDAGVAENAKRLLQRTQDPLPGTFGESRE